MIFRRCLILLHLIKPVRGFILLWLHTIILLNTVELKIKLENEKNIKLGEVQ